jgi:hypothetical protein
MGWTQSLKIFTAATKTIADLTNVQLAAGTIFGPHPLEVQSEAPAPAVTPVPSDILRPEPLPHGARPKGGVHYCTPRALWDVYVDFHGMA